MTCFFRNKNNSNSNSTQPTTTDNDVQALSGPRQLGAAETESTRKKEAEIQTATILKELLPEQPRPANNILSVTHVYFLPKIHKGVLPPPGRPVVSANGCPTEKISAFVDAFLKPLVPEIKSHVKDTTDFINKIESLGCLQKGAIIGTLDVTSLYTNIPNGEGLSVIEEKLKEIRDPRLMPTNRSLVELLEMVLTMDHIQFNGRHFLQKRGTAMGTRLAPSYANLFMENVETAALQNHEKRPQIWLRYIDDIFFVWTHGKAELELLGG